MVLTYCLTPGCVSGILADMARKLRIEYPGAVYHVMNRGDRRAAIFRAEPDYHLFLQMLAEARDNGAAGTASGVGSAGFTHCEFYGDLSSCWPSYYFTNCLFARAGLTFNANRNASSFTLAGSPLRRARKSAARHPSAWSRSATNRSACCATASCTTSP